MNFKAIVQVLGGACFFASHTLLAENLSGSPVVHTLIKNDNGLHTYNYVVQFSGNEKLEHFSVDIGQKSDAELPVQDTGLPSGKCGINPEHSTWFNMASPIRQAVETMAEMIEPVQIVRRKQDQPDSFKEAELASWVKPLQGQQDEILESITIVEQITQQKVLPGKPPLSQIYQQLLEQIREAATAFTDSYNVLLDINVEQESIRSMAEQAENVAYLINVLDGESSEFLRMVWLNRGHIPSAIVYTDKSHKESFLDCDISNANQAVWFSGEPVKISGQKITLQSYGQPGLRNYIIRFTRKGIERSEEYHGWVIGPVAPSLYPELDQNVLQLIKDVHIAHWSGWITRREMANSMIVELNKILHEINNDNNLVAISLTEKLLKRIKKNNCKKIMSCRSRFLSPEGYSLMNAGVESFLVLLRK